MHVFAYSYEQLRTTININIIPPQNFAPHKTNHDQLKQIFSNVIFSLIFARYINLDQLKYDSKLYTSLKLKA